MNQTTEQFLSLFEFLGKPAGDEGLKVFKAAAEAGIETQTSEVANKKFTGKVRTYPKSFLTDYFKTTSAQ